MSVLDELVNKEENENIKTLNSNGIKENLGQKDLF